MPIYEFTCRSCDVKFEKLLKRMGGDDQAACPACGSADTARALSVFAVNSAGSRDSAPAFMPGCGRCGGPGPCGME